ncbi:adenosylcobinamide-GDP ribazoletransferase [Acetobacteraceae bacterium H6797]|nr:adenosylcobinamide-GDP ribazoletransferase [Acetobacteraceae bacterium H6797]
MRDLLASVAACIGFYTRLPLPASAPMARDFAAAQWAAPLAGALVGLAGGLTLLAAAALHLPASLAAILALAITMLLTGALHEDGLADLADGFGGGRDRERKLEIMRDSRIGTYGICALALTILARFSALEALNGHALAAMIAAHTAGRALMPGFMALVPPARADGLSAGIGRIPATSAGLALAIGALALLLLGPLAALAAAAMLGLWFLALSRLCRRQIGGQTGDVLGALEQGGEVIVLLTACAFLA